MAAMMSATSLDAHAMVVEFDNNKDVQTLFQSIIITDKPKKACAAQFSFTRNGLRITTEFNQVVQSSVFFKVGFFNRYKLNVEHLKFFIDIQTFVNYIGKVGDEGQQFGNEPRHFDHLNNTFLNDSSFVEPKGLRLRMETPESALEMDTADGHGVHTTVVISQLLGSNMTIMDMPEISPENVIGQLDLTGQQCSELWLELDQGAEWLGILLSPTEFKFWTESDAGRLELTLNATLSYKFNPEKGYDFHNSQYKMRLVKLSTRPLGITAIRKSATNRGQIEKQSSITISENVLKIKYKADFGNLQERKVELDYSYICRDNPDPYDEVDDNENFVQEPYIPRAREPRNVNRVNLDRSVAAGRATTSRVRTARTTNNRPTKKPKSFGRSIFIAEEDSDD